MMESAMTRTRPRYSIVRLVMGLAVYLFATLAHAAAQTAPAPSPTPGGWQFRITPYVWLPTINASFHFEHGDIRPGVLPSAAPIIPNGADVRIGPSSYLTHLNSALMFTADARRGNGGFFTDLIYLNLSTGSASVTNLQGPGGIVVVPINVSTTARLSSTLWTAAVSGTPFTTSGPSPLDGFVGFRYFNLSAHAGWNLSGPLGILNPNGNADKNDTQFTPIIGIRGRIPLGEHWFVPYYGDAGANGQVTTWQGVLGIAYGYHSGAALLVWRQLSYFQQNGNPTALIQNMHLGGPAIGWTFNL